MDYRLEEGHSAMQYSVGQLAVVSIHQRLTARVHFDWF